MAKSRKEPEDQFSPKEAKERLIAALRGARIAESKPMKAIPPKRNKGATKKK